VTCEVEKLGGLIRIRGDMTIYDATPVKDGLFAALQGESEVCIDLSGVSEVDTTGVQILLMAQRACASRGVPFAVANLSDAMREALGLLRLGILTHTVKPQAAP
jgi:anti-anti-sigma factor